ncbi:hypothetical protein F5B20DRAFT_546863 [Whalleya microplaca]|nr:hypothetical protein F5B20DRAFT_546863 [Whalleya microplaca]
MATNLLDDTAQYVGWVESPNARGTMDIIWSCVVVLITAIWTVIHLNLPSKADSLTQITLRRIRWGVLSIFAPDLLTLIAASQWDNAKRSVRQMKELTGSERWTLVHAFYANSGGFHLQPVEGPSFPINADSILFLVSHGYVEMPQVTREEIWDKSKADVFAKAFALLQTGWIIIQSIARAAAGLSLSPLELFTLAFVVSTASSYFFWWYKPQHVETPMVLYSEFPVSKILADVGLPSDMPFVSTPLEFIEKSNQTWERRKMFENFDLERQDQVVGTDRVPLQRIPDDAILPSQLPLPLLAALIIPSMIHSCIHLMGWNLPYPTKTEQLLWRISAVMLAGMSCISVGMVRVLAVLGYKGKYNLVWIWINVRRQSSENRICLDFWDTILALSTFCLVIARCFIITEVVISLRHLPADVFLTVNWTNFIPHI